ncbi:hydrogenase maturation protease [Candidatus Endoriftia persephone]|jgi:hydrogenase maturation protease|uniref:Hydrogenase maturation protease n=2 Tax=Gammaproteobacteria TaxID=1236 RepID=G2DGX6_9GAMM|nr:hydrogenase maturation protease [Candidatus Endoriftia persephone]EGV50125.1 hypothetical protein Rifp1Sym_ea00040 [endosymbiont of Riftia pachyptila (vent Ph05)]USF87100.1 hydrogenase maturation protease [Candidatus Endoriftia persephone]
MRVIAVGSPFGADRVAWHAAEWLGAELPDVEVVCLDRPGSALIPWLEESVVLLDALRAEGQPGQIRRLDLAELADPGQINAVHGFGVAQALALAQALGELPQRLLLLGIVIDAATPSPPELDGAALLAQLEAWQRGAINPAIK